MPFIETALIGDENEENINHYAGIRLRVSGNGDLLMKLIGLDDNKSVNLLALPMSEASGKEPTRITNFVSQRAMLRIETDKLREIFVIDRIIFFIKPIYSSYPGNV